MPFFNIIFVNLLISALLVETSKYTIRGSLYIRLPLHISCIKSIYNYIYKQYLSLIFKAEY